MQPLLDVFRRARGLPTQRDVEYCREQWSRAPIGVWSEPYIDCQWSWVMRPDHTGSLESAFPDRIFEWQFVWREHGERSIQLCEFRCIEHGFNDAQEVSDLGPCDPDDGDWETVAYDFQLKKTVLGCKVVLIFSNPPLTIKCHDREVVLINSGPVIPE